MIALSLAVVALAAAAAPAVAPDDLARLTSTNDLLQKQVALAKGKEFYLVLSPGDRTLRLMLKGAVLQEYRVTGLQVGVPKIVYRPLSGSAGWEGRIWEGGTLDPARALDRVEMQAPPPTPEGTEPEVAVPPTPEEKYPVPARYHVRFAGGLSLEVRPPGTEATRSLWGRLTQGFSAWWADARAATGRGPSDTLRLHVELSKSDAESLYRALPPATKLIVLPPQG